MTTEEVLAILDDLRRFATDHQHVEAKAGAGGLPRRLWETISAFANTAGGGTLILGVDEQTGFAPVGVRDPRKAMQDLASICDAMVPPVRALINLHEVEGRTLVVAEIPEIPLQDKPCYYSGAGLTNGAFIRVADGDRRLNQYEVQVMRASHGQPQEDREPVQGSSIGDLHADLARSFLERLRAERPSLKDRSDHELLRMSGVVVDSDEGEAISLGGLLALGAEPQRFFPELGLTFVAYPTTRVGEAGPRGERFVDEARVDGPIPLMIEPCVRVLQRNMKRRAVVHGVGRETEWEYPITALREALVNALVHRDFSALARGTPVQVQLFPDRLTIINPGGLHGPVSVDRLGEAGVSSSRNATLMRILEDTPLPGSGHLVCENRGSGIGAMLAALREAGMSPPEFYDGVATFSVTFPNHTLFDRESLEWLARIGGDELSDNQRVGLALLRNGQSLSNEVYRKFNNIDSRVATRELRELVQRGLIQPVNSGRWTTYRLMDSAAVEQESQPEPPVVPPRADAGLAAPASEIVNLLGQRGELATSEIAEVLGIPGSTVRYWIKRLRITGMVGATTRTLNSPYTKYRLTRSSRELH
jgi:ATP-dependent DNA helicase RecG